MLKLEFTPLITQRNLHVITSYWEVEVASYFAMLLKIPVFRKIGIFNTYNYRRGPFLRATNFANGLKKEV